MTSELSRSQLRNAQRIAARLRTKGKGTLVIAVGKSMRRRAAFEQALVDAGISVASGMIDGSRGPWSQIAEIAGDRATASISWTESGGVPRRIVEALNLGREAIHELPAGLLLWFGGLRSLEEIPAFAPDLWAYRVAVIWVLSAEDFEAEVAIPVAPEMTLDAQLHEHGGALAKLAPDDIEWFWEMLDYAARLIDAGQHLEGRRTIAEVEKRWSALSESERAWNPGLEHYLFCTRVDDAISQLRDAEAWSMIDAVDWRAQVGSGESRLHAQAARFAAYLASERAEDGLAEEAYGVAMRHPWRGLNRGFTLVDFCAFQIEYMGNVIGATEACQAALAELENHYLDWMLLEAVARLRAQVAALQLRPFDTVTELHRSWFLCRSHGSSTQANKLLLEVVHAYQSIGLAAETLAWFDDTIDIAVAHASTLIAMGNEKDAHDELTRVCDACSSSSAELDKTVTDFQRLKALCSVLDGILDHTTFAEIRTRAITCLDTLIARAHHNSQGRIIPYACGWRVHLLLDLDRLDEAETRLDELLSWSAQYEGPRLRAQRHLTSARLALAQRDLERAEAAVDRSERTLLEEREHLQSRYVWRQILETRAEILAAQSKFEQARTTLAAARDRMHADGLEREALVVRHRLAEPLPGEPPTSDSLADRERAALEALRISSAASLVYEEARALANVAVIHAERGRTEPAHKMIAEAIWLAEGHLGLRAHLQRCEALIHTLVPQTS